jgi:hypothetical protein
MNKAKDKISTARTNELADRIVKTIENYRKECDGSGTCPDEEESMQQAYFKKFGSGAYIRLIRSSQVDRW